MKNHLKSGLYIVSTPIGNLEDITLRAVNILRTANIILCEDTRITGKLLEHFAISNKLMVYNDHSDDFMREKVCEMIDSGKIVALVSDAGTPLISDPGYKLVRKLQSAGYHVDIAPGPTSSIAALTLSGLPTDRFMFLGFLPKTNHARQKIFLEFKSLKATMIFFETANRILHSIEDAIRVLGDREGAVVREITKLYQESRTGKLSEIRSHYAQQEARGEIVFLISGATSASESLTWEEINLQIDQLVKDYSSKDATEMLFEQIKEETSLKKKDIYKMVLGRKNSV